MQRTLECVVCAHVYDTSTRLPKSLLCGHGFCLVCLESMMKNASIPCPKCREICEVPHGKVKKLPTNYTILELLDTVCTECQDRPHTKRCYHCSQNLCDDCHRAHVPNGEIAITAIDEFIKRLKQLEIEGREIEANVRRQGENVLEDISRAHKEKIARLEQIYDRQVSDTKSRVDSDLENQAKWQAGVSKALLEAQSFRKKYSSSKAKQAGSSNRNNEKITKEFAGIRSAIEEMEHSKPTVTKIWLDDTLDDIQVSRGKSVQVHGPGTRHQARVREKYNQQAPASQIAPVGNYPQASYKDMVGKRGTGLGEMKNPRGILVGLVGEILVADWLNDRLQVFDSELNAVRWIAIDGAFDLCKYDGYIFVTQNSTRSISVLTDRGEILRVLGTDHIQLQDPRGIASDNRGLLYVCDSGDKCIKVLKPSGDMVKEFGSEAFQDVGPRYIAISREKIYVSDNNYNLHTFDNKGQLLKTLKGGLPPNNLRVTAIAVDAEENLILSDSSGRLVVMKDGGQVVSVIGSNGRGRGQLRSPEGLTITGQGEIVVCDGGNDRIVMFDVPSL